MPLGLARPHLCGAWILSFGAPSFSLLKLATSSTEATGPLPSFPWRRPRQRLDVTSLLPAPVTFSRNGWALWSEIAGHLAPKRADTFVRNARALSPVVHSRHREGAGGAVDRDGRPRASGDRRHGSGPVHDSAPLLVVPVHAELSERASQRVLIPLDGSQVGEAALRFAHERSTVRPLELRLVQFVSVAPFFMGADVSFAGYQMSPAEVDAELSSATEYLAEQTSRIIDPGISTLRGAVDQRYDYRTILKVARTRRVDLIAVGTHAKAGVKRLVLGSVSEDIRERSVIPVLLVRRLACHRAVQRDEAGPSWRGPAAVGQAINEYSSRLSEADGEGHAWR